MWDLLPAPVGVSIGENELKVTPKEDVSSKDCDSEEDEKMVITGEDLEFHR